MFPQIEVMAARNSIIYVQFFEIEDTLSSADEKLRGRVVNTFFSNCSVPEFIPMDATAVYLDGNNFDSKALINDEFIGRKHLTSLYLNNSQIKIISNQTFKGMQTDSEIHKYVITEKGLLLILFPLLYISRIDRTSSLTSRG